MSSEQYNFEIPEVSVTSPSANTTMPLVVPGITSNSKDKTQDWSNKLMGKKLGDSSDEIVSILC
jgi:hypothetical protein